MRKNVLFGLKLAVLAGIAAGSLNAWAVQLDVSSLGYHPQGVKQAVIRDVPEGADFKVYVFDPHRRNPRFPVVVGAKLYDVTQRKLVSLPTQAPGMQAYLLDFSDFHESGGFELRVDGLTLSPTPITVNEFVFWDHMMPVVKSFYYQRCGQDVESRSPAMYHTACHVEEAHLLRGLSTEPTGQGGTKILADTRDVGGGWHHGGDYSRYVISTAIAAGRLMDAIALNPRSVGFFRLNYPIFEPALGDMPDYYHEVKAGLDWLLTMQAHDVPGIDGAVYRKVTGLAFVSAMPPEDDTQKQIIHGVTTQDTAAFAAALATGARVFQKENLGYSIKLLRAAEKAWTYLAAHPEPVWMHSSYDWTASGEFVTPNPSQADSAYRLWAATELYLATRKAVYHDYFVSHLNQVNIAPAGWENPAMLGLMDFWRFAGDKTDNPSRVFIQSAVRQLAGNIAVRMNQSALPQSVAHYEKSSNRLTAEHAVTLLDAAQITGDKQDALLASRLVASLYGINPLGQTFVTGEGGHAVQHPMHRWMEAKGSVLPGFLVDGPNEAAMDGKTPPHQAFLSYVDDAKASGVNESSILNNASLAYLLAYLNNSFNPAGVDQNPAGATGPTDTNKPKSPLQYELYPEKKTPGAKKKK